MSAADAQTELDAHTRLEALARQDKWYLSAGDGFLWAPPFPRWLSKPGFWDAAHVYHYPLEPLFSVALVGSDGLADPLERRTLDWRPDRLRARWRSRSGRTLVETRYVLPGGRFCSTWRTEDALGWPNPAFRELSLVAFTAVPGEGARDLERRGAALTWRSTLRDRKGQTLEIALDLDVRILPPRSRSGTSDAQAGDALRAACCGGVRSEGIADPVWDHTPFVELWRVRDRGLLGGRLSLDGVSERGWVHLALALPLAAVPARHEPAFVLTASPLGIEDERSREPARPGRRAPSPISADAGAAPLARHSEARWVETLASYPRFSCSDAYLTRYFDYRIYGLHLNRIEGGAGRIPHPAVAEGIEYFHLPITYSAQCHMWETRWAADAGVAHGSLLNFLAAQRPDGSLPGRLYVNHETGEDFYHANWGDAAHAVDALHPDADFMEAAYVGLSRYAEWMRAERDPENSGMVTVVNHYETGQEYMSRYIAVDADSDVSEWEPRLRLKGVDVTVYAYQLLRALETLARRFGDADGTERWRAAAEHTGRAIRERMWDPGTGLFSDVDGATGRRTGVKAAVCFYPLMTDLLDDDQVARLLVHLRDPASFATEFPVPSSAADDPFFDADGLWKGKRHNCPWNGRVWPMTNSHVVEGLLRQWHRGRAEAGPAAAHILSRFVRMMYHDGDLERANCYEHYNPRTGHAGVFRGIDDYQHSWVLDLLARGVAGVEPTHGSLRIHPLPMGLEDVRFRARLRGREIDVHVRGNEVKATVDGSVHRTRVGTPVEVAW